MPGIIPSPSGPGDYYTQKYTTTVSSSSPSAGTRIRNPNCIDCGLEMSTATARSGYSCNNCERNRHRVVASNTSGGVYSGPRPSCPSCGLGMVSRVDSSGGNVYGFSCPSCEARNDSRQVQPEGPPPAPIGSRGPVTAQELTRGLNSPIALQRRCSVCGDYIPEGSRRHPHEFVGRTPWVSETTPWGEDSPLPSAEASPGPNIRWGTTTSDRIYGEMLDNLARASSPMYYYDPRTNSVGPATGSPADWRRLENINAYWKGTFTEKEEHLEQLVSGDVGSLWDKRPLKANN